MNINVILVTVLFVACLVLGQSPTNATSSTPATATSTAAPSTAGTSTTQPTNPGGQSGASNPVSSTTGSTTTTVDPDIALRANASATATILQSACTNCPAGADMSSSDTTKVCTATLKQLTCARANCTTHPAEVKALETSYNILCNSGALFSPSSIGILLLLCVVAKMTGA